MNQGGALPGLVSLLSDALTPLASAFRWILRPALRFWRLTSLRSRIDGRIPVTTQFDGPVSTSGSGRVWLGENCRLGRDVHFDTGDTGTIALGSRVRLNAGGVIVANRRVAIGDDTLIGEFVTIRDANHGVDGDSLIRIQALVSAEVEIGRDVWIGRGACVLKGVTIGDGAVVGANSVVTQDVPPRTIFAGAPARQIGHRGNGPLGSESTSTATFGSAGSPR